MDDYRPMPTIHLSLLQALEDRFPPKDFDPSCAMRDIDYYCGARSVLQFLRRTYEDQNESILKNK